MQVGKPMTSMSYDVANSDIWEFVFIDTARSLGADGGEKGEFEVSITEVDTVFRF